MPKQQKIFSLILLAAGLAAVLYAAYPQKALEIKDMVLSQLRQKEPTEVLGSKAEDGVNLLQAEFKSSIDEISSQASQIISEKIEENKDLPEDLKEKAKEELKKQVYKQVCEQWLNQD
jgi:F0F1-type ATP synthase membrane subunit b/b'